MSIRTSSLFKLLAVFAALATAACGGGKKERFAYVERPVELLYADGAREVERKRYDRAVAYFEEVERQHPYSAWARRAMLMKAFAYYQGNDYEDSLAAIDQFIALHPGNKDVAYAFYLRAMNHYERIRDVGRDQEFTNSSVAALTDVVRRFPDTEYARDARLKLDLTYDHLAGKEMYVGRFYLKQNKHIAAINRFKRVVTQYQTTSHAPEALHRIAEAYLELGIIDEARAAVAVLGHNYPGSRWYQDSYALFEKRDLVAFDGRKRPRREASIANAPETPIEDLDPSDVADVRPPSAEELEALSADDGLFPDIDPAGRDTNADPVF
ncbi:MAG: outer membrane protein assembly factor BamD [Marinicaulis sp.]|nr:outer membrane protein assembly factor BamD [Marinicaulis sp.]